MTPLTATGNFSCHPKAGGNMQKKLGKHMPTSFDHKVMPNINKIWHYFGKAGRLLGIPMEARNGLTHLGPIM